MNCFFCHRPVSGPHDYETTQLIFNELQLSGCTTRLVEYAHRTCVVRRRVEFETSEARFRGAAANNHLILKVIQEAI
jgi:hypothetical protein